MMRCNGLVTGVSSGFFMAVLTATAAAAPVRFDRLCGPPGIHLGMSVDDWKALAFPGAGPGFVQPVCSDDPAAANFLGAITASAPGDPLVCGYADRIGSFLTHSAINLLGSYPAQQLRYYFPTGRLTRIDCVTSDSAFHAFIARLETLHGPPRNVVWDKVRTETGWRPRVKESWSIPGGSVTLTDPVQPSTNLSLEYRSSDN
jgi:hypothetical protein